VEHVQRIFWCCTVSQEVAVVVGYLQAPLSS
jgi:hypothetical protein